MAESFSATFKNELIYRHPWPTKARTETAVITWIEGRYNRRRRHSAIGMQTPGQFETAARHTLPPRQRDPCPPGGVNPIQPHPRRLPWPRCSTPRHHRHHPCPADQRPGPPHPLGASPDPAPAQLVALGEGVAATPRRLGPRPTTNSLTRPSRPTGPDPRTPWRSAGPPGDLNMHSVHPAAQPAHIASSAKARWWIRA
jgi:hypothetical protein